MTADLQSALFNIYSWTVAWHQCGMYICVVVLMIKLLLKLELWHKANLKVCISSCYLTLSAEVMLINVLSSSVFFYV